ncbi:MAG: hypothetical protein U0103_16735 [Candidatus Obscuribacterales bacterium]
MSMAVVPGIAVPVYGQQNASVSDERAQAPIVICDATPADLEILYQMSVALAFFERKSAAEIELTREKIWRCAFGPNKVFSALIARRNGQPVGMAVFYYAMPDPSERQSCTAKTSLLSACIAVRE